MKKLLTLLLILMLTLSMTACGGNDDTPDTDGTGTENNVVEESEDGDVLVDVDDYYEYLTLRRKVLDYCPIY